MTELSGVIHSDPETGVTEVTLTGPLNVRTARVARMTLMKSIAEQPSAILIDLNGLTVESAAALSVLPSAARHAMGDIVILAYVAAATPTGRAVRDIIDGLLPVYEDRVAAMTAALDHPTRPPRVHARYPADPASVAAARALARHACVHWAVEHLSHDAQLIVSELVTNGIEHARSAVEVVLERRSAMLHIRVRDGSAKLPAFPISQANAGGRSVRGRGLRLVTMVASGWGITAERSGKTIWATLRIRPIG